MTKCKIFDELMEGVAAMKQHRERPMEQWSTDEPETPEQSLQCLRELQAERRRRHVAVRADSLPPRLRLSRSERAEILRKSDGCCYICGGKVAGLNWQADRVLAHNAGGAHSVDNFLPAHKLCNTYRWDHSAEELQWVLKIGVWARRRMEVPTAFGSDLLDRFFKYEKIRMGRTVRGATGSRSRRQD